MLEAYPAKVAALPVELFSTLMGTLDFGTGVIQNQRSTDSEYPAPPPGVCMSIHPEGKSCSDLGRVLDLNDPTATLTCR